VTRSGNLAETEILEVLRDRYLSEGYQFIVQPSRDLTPSFLGNYRPDAIALKGSGGVVFEIKSSDPKQVGNHMAEIARRFDGHPEWRFELVFASNFVGERRPFAGIAEFKPLSDREFGLLRSEVAILSDQGHHAAALLMAWALLEAAGRRALSEEAGGAKRLLTGWQLIEQLFHLGLFHPDDLKMMRRLFEKRNAVAHAVPSAIVGAEDVTTILKLVDDLAAGERV
jgi:hypothetical protein